jgi:hypothetical protein
MRISSAVREFIESIPHDELYVDRLRDLAKTAGRLAAHEPLLPFLAIQRNFVALADSWDGEVLDVSVSREITPPVRNAVRKALEQPGAEATLEFERVMRWAISLPLEDAPPN